MPVHKNYNHHRFMGEITKGNGGKNVNYIYKQVPRGGKIVV